MDDIERLRKVFDEGPLGVAVLDATYRLVDVNSRFCEMLGYGRDELMALTVPEFTHPEDISKDVSLAAKLFRGEIPRYEIEKRFIRKNGEIIWGRLHASVVHDESGEPEFGLEMIEDITGRKREFEALFENQQDGVALVVKGRFSRVNARLVDMLGRSEEELVGMPAIEVLMHEDRDRSVETMAEILDGAAQFPSQVDIVRPDGGKLSVQALSRPVEHEGQPAILTFVRDVSELESARRALEQSEERFRHLSEGAIEGTAITDQGIMLDANPQFVRLFGYELRELVGAPVASLVAPESREHVSKQIAAGNDRPYEHMAIRKDGTTFPVQAHGKAMEYEGRTVRVTNIRDITERRRADDALRESEAKFRTVTEASPAAILVIQDEKVPFANAAAIEIGGYSAAELAELNYLELVHPDDRADAKRRVEACQDGSEPSQTWRHRTITKSGAERWVEPTIGLTEFQGRPAVIAVSTDVTENIRVDDALRESEAKFRTVTEASPAAILVIQDEKIPFANPAMIDGSEYSASELAELNYLELFLPADREAAVGHVEACLDGSEPFQTWRHLTVTKSGVEGWFETTIGPAQFQGQPAVIAVATDVTEQMRTEEALRESESRFRELAEDTGAGIVIIDETERFVYANPAIRAMTEYTWEELKGMKIGEVVHPDQRETVRQHILSILRGDREFETFRLRMWTKDGQERWLETTNRRIHFEGSIAILGTAIDITVRMKAEEELRKSEERFRELAETSQAAIFIVNGPTIVYANPAGETLLGRTLGELQAIDYWEAAHPDDREALIEHFEGAEAAGGIASPYTYRVVKPDGEVRWVEASGAMTTFKGADAGTVILLDVTDRVRAEEATQQARDELEGKVERQMLRKNPYELTFRELTVLHHVAAGEADKEIASELGISPLTAQNHVASILRKMDAPSRTAAGVRAVRDGLVD